MKFARNKVSGLAAVVLAVCYLAMAFKIPASTMVGDPGPRIYPIFAGVLMLTSGIVLFLRKPKEFETKAWMTGEQKKRMWGLYALIVAYVLLLGLCGYTLPTFLMLTVMCALFAYSTDVKLPLWQSILYGAVLTVLIWLLFTKVLKVTLPMGTRFPQTNFLRFVL